MSNAPFNLTRNQLAAMAPNARALRALEDMLRQVNDGLPSDIDSIAADASLGVSQSSIALSAIERIAHALEMLALAPSAATEPRGSDDLAMLAPPSPQDAAPALDMVQFYTEGAKPAYKPGRLFYDAESRALAYYSETAGVTLDIGKEMIVTVVNATGSPLTDGELVYISGESGGWPTVTRAQADTAAASQSIIGMVTAPISVGGIGDVCVSGIVHDLDTSAYSPGAELYLSATTPGGFTSIPPLQPNYVVEVATVVTQSATAGKVYIHIDKKAWFPSIEIRDTTASVALPTTPTVFLAPTVAHQNGFTYDSATGILTVTQSASYAISITFNAEPSASNKNIYFYAEEDSGSGWTPARYSARTLHLPNATETQVLISAARYYAVGTKIRFYIWGDSTVTLRTTDLPGTTPGTVTLPAYRFLMAG